MSSIDSLDDTKKEELLDTPVVAPKKQDKLDRWLFRRDPHLEIDKKFADVTYEFFNKTGRDVNDIPDLTPAEEKKLVLKLWYTIVPICFVVNATLFIDKDAISYSSLLGVYKDMNITSQKYNNIQTFFYVGYFVGQIPSHLLFQRFRISHYISGAAACWALISYCTLACKSYAGMSVLRFFLGLVESGITPCVEHTLAMFFTIEEQAIVNPIFWISCLGIDVPTGFFSYGLQFTTRWRPWKWYWLFVGMLSTIVATLAFFIFPDNPASARMFTLEERIHIIRRVKKSSHSSIEQKTFKKYQAIEALRDPVSWLFFLAILMNMLENSTTYQASTIYKQLGFSNLTTTLLMVVQNGFSMTCAIVGSTILRFARKQSCIVSASFMMPALLGAILAISLPYDNKPGLLAGIFLTRTNGTAYIILLSLSTATAAGYTKRLIRTIMFMFAYSIANFIAPQMWRVQYQPRYRVPWIMQIVFSWSLAPLVVMVIRYILVQRNKERRAYIAEHGEQEFGYIDTIDENGKAVKQKVEISMLDLTDFENKTFIYPL